MSTEFNDARADELMRRMTNAGMSPDDARAILQDSASLGVEAFRVASDVNALPADGNGGPSEAGSNGPMVLPAAAEAADITEEAERAGPAFGSFVKSVGLAVAEAQTQLDKSLVDTAKALSEQKINVIAFLEQLLDDDGKLMDGNEIMQELPLINYLMPTAYQWSRVYLEADMNVSEFNTANGFNIQGKSSSFGIGASGGYGLLSGGWNARGGISYSSGNYQASGGTSYSQDFAAGHMRMEATLEPRGDIQIPQPMILQKGPTLQVLMGEREDIMDAGNGTAVIGRRVKLTAVVTRSDGSPNSGKTLGCNVDRPDFNYSVSGNGTTDPDGKVVITVERRGAAFSEDSFTQAQVRVWLGLVNQAIPISL